MKKNKCKNLAFVKGFEIYVCYIDCRRCKDFEKCDKYEEEKESE